MLCARWAFPEEETHVSGNGLHAVRVKPHPRFLKFPGRCLATLSREGRVIWSRTLVNDFFPCYVFVSDSGEYVVTMGEWGDYTRSPLVIYGPGGRLVCVHSPKSLGLLHELMIMIREGHGIEMYWHWQRNSVCFFMEEENMFCIRLNSRRIILVQLRDGGIVGDEDAALLDGRVCMPAQEREALEKKATEAIRKQIPAMFSSESPRERETAALVCGQEHLVENVEALRGLLRDDAWYWTKGGDDKTVRVYYVRKATVEALQALKQEVGDVVIEEPAEHRQ